MEHEVALLVLFQSTTHLTSAPKTNLTILQNVWERGREGEVPTIIQLYNFLLSKEDADRPVLLMAGLTGR